MSEESRDEAARRLFAIMAEQSDQFGELSVLLAMAKYAQWRNGVHAVRFRKLSEMQHVTDAAYKREMAGYFAEAAETLTGTVGGVDLLNLARKPSLRIVKNPVGPRRKRIR